MKLKLLFRKPKKSICHDDITVIIITSSPNVPHWGVICFIDQILEKIKNWNTGTPPMGGTEWG